MTTTSGEHITYFVGIDISKAQLDCWLRPFGQHLRCSNDKEGFEQLHKWLYSHGCEQSNTVLCLENTGIYGKRLLRALHKRGWRCSLEKTTVLDKIGPDHHRKGDRFDAQLLAEYASRFTDQLNMSEPAEAALDQMQQLYSERRRLVRQRTATKTKQTQSDQEPNCPDALKEGWKRQITLFDRQINTLEKQIQDIVDTHKGLTRYYELLTGIPGVGQVSGWLWLIMFYGQQKLNPKKIASRFGVAPHSHCSGSSVRGKTRSSGHGAAEMRSSLTMAAQSASTHHKKFRRYKQRKLKEGKPWPVVRNNLVNKLITVICAIWNSGQSYDPNHQSRFDRQKNVA